MLENMIDHTWTHMFQMVPLVGILPHKMDGESLQSACLNTERFYLDSARWNLHQR